jgi:DNA-binding Lrp family transcriptional regulator
MVGVVWYFEESANRGRHERERNQLRFTVDSFDLELIKLMELSARAPMLWFAEKLGSDRHKIKKRIEKLEKSGIINSYRAAINDYIIQGGFLAIISVKAKMGMVNKLIPEFLKFHEIFSVYVLSGEYDLELVCEFQSKEECEKLLLEKLSLIEGIERTRCEIFLRYYFHGRRLLAASPDEGEKKAKSIKLTDVDRGIIRLIRFHARAPKKWIGEQLGIPISSVSKRLKRLELLGVVCGYFAIVDYTKLGFNVKASIRLRVDPQKYRQVLSRILKIKPEWVAEMLGETDLHFRVNVTDAEALRRLIRDEIGQTQGIQRIDTHFVFKSYHR